jgi:hypothetical protein
MISKLTLLEKMDMMQEDQKEIFSQIYQSKYLVNNYNYSSYLMMVQHTILIPNIQMKQIKSNILNS